ncbi:MAG TPA: universal stress protein, partial [Nocardioidaceae bacterium]|nr:universal stress protein [Nocardioidaceae bacterium]
RGFEAARLHGNELTIMHAWTAPKPYESVLAGWDADAWKAAALTALDQQTRDIRDANRDVVTHLVATYGTPGDALSELVGAADFIVLGRHRGDASHLPRLGSVAQHALHSGRSVLEIVPVPDGAS